MLVDGDKLLAWIGETITSLANSRDERFAADGEDDPAALRMAGGVANLVMIQNTLHNFEWRPEQTPIDQISVPVEHKVQARGRGTSFYAATLQSAEKSRRLYQAIYAVLHTFGPKNDHEISRTLTKNKIEHTPSGLRTRRKELVDAGWVEDSGVKRPSESGSPSVVWRAVEAYKAP